MDDFVYLCDDAYTPKEVRDMEADVLATLNYDINIPVAYQFLRRYAKVIMGCDFFLYVICYPTLLPHISTSR